MRVKNKFPKVMLSNNQLVNIVKTREVLYIPFRLKKHRYVNMVQQIPFLMMIFVFWVSGGLDFLVSHRISCNSANCEVFEIPVFGIKRIEVTGVRHVRVDTIYAENDAEQPLYAIVFERTHGTEVWLEPLPYDTSYWAKEWFVFQFNRKLKKATQSPTDNYFFMRYTNPKLYLSGFLTITSYGLSVIALLLYNKGLTAYSFDKKSGKFLFQQRGAWRTRRAEIPLSEIVRVYTDQKYDGLVILERQSGKPFPILVQANYKPEELAELIRQFLANPPVENA